MIALGLDLSLTGTGWASLDTDTGALNVGTIETKPGPTEPRLEYIVGQLPLSGMTALAAIEDIAHGAIGGSKSERAALYWLTRIKLHHYGIPRAAVNVSHVKQYATGGGAATKAKMIDAMHRRLGTENCPEFEDDNQVDAAWLALMAAAHLGHPVVELPAAQRAVLGKVAWPELISA